MRFHRGRAAVLSITLGCTGPAVLLAQGGHIALGPRLGYDFDAVGHDLSVALLGAQVVYSTNDRVVYSVSFDKYTTEGEARSTYRLNFDLRYHPPGFHRVLFLGTGFTFAHHDGPHSKAGVNLSVGLSGGRAWVVTPFAEGRWLIFSRYTSFSVLTGMQVGL